MSAGRFLEIYQSNSKRYIDHLDRFLRFKSVSTDPAFDKECLKCADWLKGFLGDLGLESSLLDTSSKPVVYGEYKGDDNFPTVLYYGHYDVQPPEPLSEWISPPFEPEVRNGRIYARGAQDNKGQTMYFLEALGATIKEGLCRCTVKVFIEGEEETGSRGISEAFPQWSSFARGNVLMVCDTGVVPSGAPTIVMGLRGVGGMTVRLKGPRYDLHSGIHGGAVKNPAIEMAKIISSFFASDGSVSISGFYDGIEAPTKEELALAKQGCPSDNEYAAIVGVMPDGGEAGLSLVERACFRPTLEVNGIHSGYGGAGSKTIIPSEAEAKLSWRLVVGQDPNRVLKSIKQHIEAICPPSITVSFTDEFSEGGAIKVSPNSQYVKIAREVLTELSDLEVVYRWEGASVPVVAKICEASGAEPLLVGFGTEEDRIHAPNESFLLDHFKRGFLYVASLLHKLSSVPLREISV
ncbi:MAG: M20/M25/M40 family metallo-hydrolase [Candidatus Dadabacteria bacterium]|nr:MAG: M20/M25/M40 family metallo-hydrolase [Candidatus Dadabacteria bacterium]